MRYRLSSAAQHDLDDVWLYIAQDNMQAADRFLDAVEDKLVMIAAHPNMGRPCEEFAPGLRRFPVGSYVIFYRRLAAHIEIVRVLHSARDIDEILNSPEEP